MFLDGSSIPLSFSIFNGNMNEQISLKPLEQKIIKDFNCSDFIVCTDEGLSSKSNRDYITTQSIKKLDDYLKDWVLDPNGWRCTYDMYSYKKTGKELYNLKEATESEDSQLKYSTFYKERWIKDKDGFEQRLIVIFSLDYKKYLDDITLKQLERVNKKIKSNRVNTKRNTDATRFIDSKYFTNEGDLATKSEYSLNVEKFIKENQFNGFYGICTSLEKEDGYDALSIVRINSRRWKIERLFRILKNELSARPVYLSRPDRINAHFLTCFIALQLITILDKLLDSKYPIEKVISTLRHYNFLNLKDKGFIPSYTRNEITDFLHEKFNFRTDYEINDVKRIKKIIKERKKRKIS